MADVLGGHHRSPTWSAASEQVDTRHRTSNIPSSRLATTGSSSILDHDHDKNLGVSKSRRTLRQTGSMIPERKAYPLPDPSQFEKSAAAAAVAAEPQPSSSSSSSSSSSEATNEILYPMQSFKRFAEREIETSKLSPQVVVTSPRDAPMGEKQPAPPQPALQQPSNIQVGLKQPVPPEKAPSVTEPVLGTLQEEVTAATVDDISPIKESKVVVVCDGDKKFNTAAVDVALRDFATAEGDAIVVVAFLEHIMSPMGMKMAADLQQFGGVNETILKQAVLLKKRAIESKLKDTNRSEHCAMKKIQLDVKVLPGSNSKALVAKQIKDFQATCAIFDKNAMKGAKYYEDNLSCHILRLRSDGRKVETVCVFGQGANVERTSSATSHCSDSSSDSGSGSMNLDSPTIWSKLMRFGSKRSTGPLRHSSGSGMGSNSRTSSNLGSPRPSSMQEDIERVAEVLEESFSFDSPKPNPAEAYVYAAAGLDRKFGSCSRSRNGESNNLSTALAA